MEALLNNIAEKSSKSKKQNNMMNTSFFKVDKNDAAVTCFSIEDDSYKFKVQDKWYNSVLGYMQSQSKDAEESKLFDLLTIGYHAKFSASWSLKAKLLASGARVIVAYDADEKVFSCGCAVDDPASDSPFLWSGKNLLGYALMHVRCALKDEWKRENIDAQGNRIKKQKTN